jgi:hypothetical protein
MNYPINPHMLRTAHKAWHDPRFAGGKFYYAVLLGQQVYRARQTFRHASDAEWHAKRLKVRWIALYEAAIKLNPELVPNPLQD